MTEVHPRRYWDSCSFIAVITGEEGRAENCQKLLQEAARGKFLVVTSRLTLVEVTRKRGVGVLTEQRAMIEQFFDNDYITLVDLDPRVVDEARDLIWAHASLRPNDAIHLASARRARCSLFYTHDTGLLKLDGKIPGVEILEPVWTGQLALQPGLEPPAVPSVRSRPQKPRRNRP